MGRKLPPPPPPPGILNKNKRRKENDGKPITENSNGAGKQQLPPPPPPPSSSQSLNSKLRPPPPPPPPPQPSADSKKQSASSTSLENEQEPRKRTWSNVVKSRRQKKSDTKRSATQVIPQKPEMPPQHLRKIMIDHGDLTLNKIASDKRSHLGSLKYLPHALLKLLENMPQPWEQQKEVKVLYHTTGAITFVNEIPRVIESVYIAQWATTWNMMRREKKDRKHFKRMRFPPFDDEEPPLDWLENLDDTELVDAIRLKEIEDDDELRDWFYDTRPLVEDPDIVNGDSYRKWNLDFGTMNKLYQLSRPILHEGQTQKFDKNSLFTE